jgi:predicted negative regulator of RcsB-dependent stress response
MAVVERLAASDRSSPGWRMLLYVSYSSIGGVLVAQGKPDEALKSYRDSMAIVERLADSDRSSIQHALSSTYLVIGGVLVAQGKLDEALESYRDSLATAERLAASDRGNPRWRILVSVCHSSIGDVLVRQGKPVRRFRQTHLPHAGRRGGLLPGRRSTQQRAVAVRSG